MNAKTFPLPSSVKVVPGTEAAQAAYPYYMQFTKEDDQRFWFYNSMHFPEPMCAFDSVTGEAAYCALGAANTRVHCLPTTKGIDERIINGRIYIGGIGVTDPAEIKQRTDEFMQRAFYYYETLGTPVRPVEGQDARPDRGCAAAAEACRCRNTNRWNMCAPGAASRRTTSCWIPTRRRWKATSGCGITTSSSCCWVMART